MNKTQMNNHKVETTDIGNQQKILEAILSYKKGATDVTETAKNLLKKFGTLANIIDAEYDELVGCDGLTEITASLLKLIPEIYSQYALAKCNNIKTVNSNKEAIHIFKLLLSSSSVEQACVLCLDKNHNLIKILKLGNGDKTSIRLSPHTVVQQIIKQKPKYVYFSHNHVLAISYPSCEDVQFTENLYMALQSLDVELLDHIIISPFDEFSFLNCRLLDYEY